MSTLERGAGSSTAGIDIAFSVDLTGLVAGPPRLPAGSITRPKLIERLQSAHDSEVIAVVAPIGFGKTTLLAQWVDDAPLPMAWLTLSRIDNDESTLLSHIGMAMSQVGLIDEISPLHVPGQPMSLVPPGSPNGIAPGTPSPHGVLILDQVEAIKADVVSRVIGRLLDRFQGRLQLVIASRSSKGIPVAKLRSQGRILEFTEQDLRFDDSEARELLRGRRIEPDHQLANLIKSSEGWPVALTLLAVAAESQSQSELPEETHGDDRYLAEYFSSEILSKLPSAQRAFLIKTSILDRLTGRLCDAVLERGDSERTLRRIAEQTSLIHAIDRPALWYATNGLLREALRAELERQEPKEVRDLHARAAQWYEANDLPASAIHHAHVAGDQERFIRMLGQRIQTEYVLGRADSVLQWLAWFEAEVPLGDYPEIAAVGALIHAMEGTGLAADRWSAGAGSHPGEPPPVLSLVRALGTRDGLETMIEDTRAARRAMSSGSFWIPATFLVEGMGHLWDQDLAAADSCLAESVALGREAGAMLTLSVGLVERGSIAMTQGDWDGAHHLVTQSLRIIEEHGLDSYSTSGLSFALAARISRHKGDPTGARSLLGRGSPSRTHLGTSIPGLAVQTLLEMATAYLELADAAGARVLARDAHDIVSQRPLLGSLLAQLEALDEALSRFGSGVVGPSAMTTAELRVLPLLATHLTFPEIGDRLYVSRHTVKSHAMSIYRKLGTSTRSEAVARAVELGLLRD